MEGIRDEHRVDGVVLKRNLFSRPAQRLAIDVRAHPVVGLDRDHAREPRRERACELAGAGREIEDGCSRREPELPSDVVDHRRRVFRPRALVGVGDAPERPADVRFRRCRQVARS